MLEIPLPQWCCDVEERLRKVEVAVAKIQGGQRIVMVLLGANVAGTLGLIGALLWLVH